MNRVPEMIMTIATAIVGLAVLAILVSQKAKTSDVLKASGGAFATALSAAEAPVTGASSGGGQSFGFSDGGSGFGLGNMQGFGWPQQQ